MARYGFKVIRPNGQRSVYTVRIENGKADLEHFLPPDEELYGRFRAFSEEQDHVLMALPANELAVLGHWLFQVANQAHQDGLIPDPIPLLKETPSDQ